MKYRRSGVNNSRTSFDTSLVAPNSTLKRTLRFSKKNCPADQNHPSRKIGATQGLLKVAQRLKEVPLVKLSCQVLQ